MARDYNFRVVTFQVPASTGNFDVQPHVDDRLGTTPVGAIIFTSRATSIGSIQNVAMLSIGAYDGTRQRCVCAMGENGNPANTTDTGYRIDTATVGQITLQNGEGLDGEFAAVSFATDKITFNVLDAPGSAVYAHVVLVYGTDADFYVDHIDGSSTIGGTATKGSLGFDPDLALLASCGQAFVADGAGAEAMMSFGGAGRLPSVTQGCVVWCAEDRNSPSSTGSIIRDDCAATQLTSAGATVTEGARLEVSFGSGSVTVTTRNAAVSHSALLIAIGLGGAQVHVDTVLPSSGTGSISFPGVRTPYGFVAGSNLSSVNSLSSTDGSMSVGAWAATGVQYEGTSGLFFQDAVSGVSTVSTKNGASDSLTIDVIGTAASLWNATFIQTLVNGVEFSVGGTPAQAVFIAIEDARRTLLFPGGIASTSAFGTPSVASSITLSPGGIASTSAFGTPTIDQVAAVTLFPGSIASASAFGTPSIAATITLSPGGIASTSAFGTPSIATTITLSPGGIASDTAFGTPSVASSITLSPGGIASDTAFGTPSVAVGAVTLSPGGIPSDTAFGTPSIAAGAVTLSPGGIASTSAFGTPDILTGQTVRPDGIPSDSAFGTPTLVAGAVTLSPGGIASTSAFGTPSVTQVTTLSPGGIPSDTAFGTPSIATGAVTLTPGGIASDTAFGTPSIAAGAVTLTPGGIATGSAFGTPTVTATVTLSPGGIPSDTAFGTPTLDTGVAVVFPAGIASGSAFGTPTLIQADQLFDLVELDAGSRFLVPAAAGTRLASALDAGSRIVYDLEASN